MGRAMTHRLRVRGWLETVSPLHVGGLGSDPNADLALAVDGQGRYYVPGTGLAGPMRRWCERHDPADVRQRWGYVSAPGSDGTSKDLGRASRVVVHDTVLNPASVITEIRTSVGIDRVTGATAPGILYSRALIPSGTRLRLELEVESRTDTLDDDRQMVEGLLDALACEEIRFGAAKTRGLGRVRLTAAAVKEESYADRADLLASLRADWPPETPRQVGDRTAAPDVITVDIGWRPASPIMVRAALDGYAIDSLPLVGAAGEGKVRLVLPGSSIKGALRSHAERIERTVRRSPAERVRETASSREASGIFRRQVAGPRLAAMLFGDVPRRRKDGKPEDERAGAGAVLVEDCRSKADLTRTDWDTLCGLDLPGDEAQAEATTGEPGQPDPRATGAGQAVERERAAGGERAELDATLRARLHAAGLDQADHVAIDRWTGGAADGRLYSVLEPHGVEWEHIRLEVDLRRLCQWDLPRTPARDDAEPEGDPPDPPHQPSRAAQALLLLVLRDLKAGWIPLGFGVNRGFGDLDVSSLTITGLPSTSGPVAITDVLAEVWEGLGPHWRAEVASQAGAADSENTDGEEGAA